jgi:hypothetical protein
MRRVMLMAAALAIPLSGAILVVGSPAAWAGVKITCTTINGNLSTLTVSGCSGGNTGGRSEPISTLALESGGTVTWVSGSTTTISRPALASTNAKKCPGYVKGASSEPSAEKFTATVTADTGDGIKVPGKAKGAVCISQSDNITALKAMKLS